MPDIYFSADTHFGHGRIIQYCNRPFKDSDEMDAAIINRFNEVLRPGDILYHLGDVAWSTYQSKNFIEQLNTKEVQLILGNHDKHKESEYVAAGFKWVGRYKGITIDKIPVALFHYPMRSWNHKGHGGLALYGHCHGTLEPGLDRSMDVGVDTHNFYPYSWEEIRDTLNKRHEFSEGDGFKDAHNKNSPEYRGSREKD